MQLLRAAPGVAGSRCCGALRGPPGGSGLRAAAAALHRRPGRGDPAADRRGRVVDRAERAGAVLELPLHGGHRACSSSRCSRRRSICRRATASNDTAGSCAWRSAACRCRGLPRSSAGSSPSTAASPGRSTACCRPSSASRAPRAAMCWLSLTRFRASSIPRWPWWTSTFWLRMIRARSRGPGLLAAPHAGRDAPREPHACLDYATLRVHLVADPRRAADRALRSWTASTSGRGQPFASRPHRRRTARTAGKRSSRCGRAIRCGSSSAAARCLRRGRCCTRPPSPGCTWRCSCCWSR